MKRQLHLNLFVHSRGHHEAAWRHPRSTPYALTDVRYFQELAVKAEGGLFDSLFFADYVALGNEVRNTGMVWLEPLTLLGALAVSTKRIGFIATATTSYTEPYNLARQFSSLDHISNGRIGWNIVTTWMANAARNFSHDKQAALEDRYAQGDEFVEVVSALWDSWSDDAVADDRASGLYGHLDRIRPINHEGKHYSVAGPLNLPRSPQGRPVYVQAGSSETGRAFAAKHAEAIFTAHLEKVSAQAFYKDLKGRAAELGRRPEQILILPGLSPMIADTEAEAKRLARELDDLSDIEVGRSRLMQRFGGHDFSHLPLDKTLKVEDFPNLDAIASARSRAELVIDFVRREQPTLRRVLSMLAGARGHFTFAGVPEQVADLIVDWFEGDAADGFNIMPPILPWQLDVFIAEVVPILQKRGLFRTAYEGTTLRDHLGLERPSVRRG